LQFSSSFQSYFNQRLKQFIELQEESGTFITGIRVGGFSSTTYPGTTQSAGIYPANEYGLHVERLSDYSFRD